MVQPRETRLMTEATFYQKTAAQDLALNEYLQRLSLVETLGGLAPGNVSDSTMASIAMNAQSAFRAVMGSRYVNKNELVFRIQDYGDVDNTGVRGVGAAVKAAVAAALAANVSNSITGATGRTAPRAPVILFPAGVYNLDLNIFADLQPTTSEAATDKTRITWRGDGSQSTVININASLTGSAINFTRGSVTFEGLQFNGLGTATCVFFELGKSDRGTDYLNQSIFRDVHFTNGGPGSTYVKLSWAYDLAWYDCHFRSIGLGGIMVDVPVNIHDNVNNVLWSRCHWENGNAATFIRVRSNFTSGGIHTSWTFDQCHWEARSMKTRAIDAEGISRWTFITPHMPQNDVVSGTSTLPADTVSWIRLVNCTYVMMISAGITRQGAAAAHARKLFSIGGYSRSVEVRNSYVNHNTTGLGNYKNSAWEEDAAVPLTANRGVVPIDFPGSTISLQYATDTPVAPELLMVQDPASTLAWSQRVDAITKALVFGNGNIGQDIRTGRTDRVTLDPAGGINLLTGSLNGRPRTLLDGETGAFNMSTAPSANSNKRGIYIIFANSPDAGAWALVFSTGAALQVIAAGSAMSVGNVDPGTAGKFSVFLSSLVLQVANRTGTARAVSVVPLGFGG